MSDVTPGSAVAAGQEMAPLSPVSGKASATSSRPRPLVSVGLPVYNGARYLERAVQSIVAQDYDHFELIISDNASTDGTAALAQRLAATDPRIKYYRNPTNVGAARNFQRVLELSTGEYFTWLAHDDHCASQFLGSAVDFLAAHHDVVLCASAVAILDEAGEHLRTEVLSAIAAEVPWPQAAQSFFRASGSNVYLAVYGVYRRDILARQSIAERFCDGRPVLDQMELLILSQMALHGRIVALPQPLRSYTLHPESCWHQERAAFTSEQILRSEDDMRVRLTRVALAAALPIRPKLELIVASLRNFYSVRHLAVAVSRAVRDGRPV